MGKSNGHGEGLSALTTAAAALDAELRRYIELAAAAVRVPLTSEKNLERAARAITDAAESEKRVLEDVQKLVQAITAAREAQQSSSEALSAHVNAVSERQGELEALLARFAKLGEIAKTLNVTMQKIAGYKMNPYAAGQGQDGQGGEVDELRRAFAEMEVGMGTVATHAQELAAEATGKSFEDLARQAEALRQQVLSAKNRLSLLQKALPGS